MDKNEYRAKLEEINELVDRQNYKGALKIVDTIDWRRVRSARTLCMVGEIYEANKRYSDSRKLLLLARQRAPIGKTVLYRLVELAVKMGDFDEAINYYKQFVEISPNDNSRYILKYKICRARRSSIEEQISILQEYKSREYTERWAYELARLYAKAGMKEACVEECDDLILWFSEGKYVMKAMELKMKYAPLTAAQQQRYDQRLKNRPSASAAVTASAVTAATAAAAKVVENAGISVTPQLQPEGQDKEIEDILNSIVIGDMSQKPEPLKQEEQPQAAPEELPIYSPKLEQPEDLQDKVAQGIRDMFQSKTSALEADEAAAAMETAEPVSPEEKGYVIKDLEPEDIQKTMGFKPFHAGGNLTMEVKAEAPKSKNFEQSDFAPEAFKADIKERELDLEQLLAETANELAQAVAEETEEAEKTAETEAAQPETVNKEEAIGQQPVNSEVKEALHSETEEEQTSENIGLTAPAAARAAIVAKNLTDAFAAKAEELEPFMAEQEKTAEAAEEAQEEAPTEALEEAREEVPTEALEEAREEVPTEALEEAREEAPTEAAEETQEEISTEASEKVQEEIPEDVSEKSEEEPEELPQEDEDNSAVEVSGETPENAQEGKQEASEIPVSKEEQEAEILEDATKEFPVEEVKKALGEIEISEVPEEELSDSAADEKEEPHMKRVTASMAKEHKRKSMAFNTAMEGIMRHHLTEEEHKRLFTYFAPIPGMTQQINEALDIAQESACEKTSQSGNFIVTGREGSGKTRLSEGLIKALCKERKMEGAKVAYVTAKQLNKKDPVTVIGKMAGGFLVIEEAGDLKPEIIENMSKAMEFKTNRLTVILEDLKPGIRSLEQKYPEFMSKFDSRIVIPVFTNDELVSFAKTYAKELGYKIDDMAVLALYTLIGDNQNDENPVAIAMVREMMEDAIKLASRRGRKAGKKVAKRHLDESGRIMLYEKDFDV